VRAESCSILEAEGLPRCGDDADDDSYQIKGKTGPKGFELA
jgi:hypothetical protein